MIKLSEKHRKLLRKIYMGLGASITSLGFLGCWTTTAPEYGMIWPPDQPEYGPPPWRDEVVIHGKVLAETKNTPIPDIRVSIKDFSVPGYTDINGEFFITVPKQDLYKLKFEDIDGPANGSFKLLKKKIDYDETVNMVTIHLEEENAQ